MPGDSERDDRLEGRIVDRSRATLSPYSSRCGLDSVSTAYATPWSGLLVYVLTLNSNFYSKGSGVSGLTWRSWYLGKLITCITVGSRKRRTMAARYAISAERSQAEM